MAFKAFKGLVFRDINNLFHRSEFADFFLHLGLHCRDDLVIEIDYDPKVVLEFFSSSHNVEIDQKEKGEDENGETDGEQSHDLGSPGLFQIPSGLVEDSGHVSHD